MDRLASVANPDGNAPRGMGWAPMYRRGRVAAGAPLNWGLFNGCEVAVAPRGARLPEMEETLPRALRSSVYAWPPHEAQS